MTHFVKAFYDILSSPRGSFPDLHASSAKDQIRLTRDELRALFVAELDAADSTHSAS